MQFDGTDREILSILLKSADTSKAEIARRVGLAASAISERIKRLEEAGIITGYAARLNGKALGAPLLAFVFISEAKPNQGFDTAAALAGVSGVEEVHKIAGDDCFICKVRCAGTDELTEILDTEIDTIPTVTGVRTTIVLKSVLETAPMSGVKLLAQEVR